MRAGGPSQGWRTFLRNHRDGVVSIDLLTTPTITGSMHWSCCGTCDARSFISPSPIRHRGKIHAQPILGGLHHQYVRMG
jgi:hypothetical protein